MNKITRFLIPFLLLIAMLVMAVPVSAAAPTGTTEAPTGVAMLSSGSITGYWTGELTAYPTAPDTPIDIVRIHFEYGLTNDYGFKSGGQTVRASRSPAPATITRRIPGRLIPGYEYHYRMVIGYGDHYTTLVNCADQVFVAGTPGGGGGGDDLSAVAEDIIPTADSTYDLGDSSHYFRNGYIDSLTAPSLTAPTGGTAAYFIAASDATDAEKAHADEVLDDDSDETQINAALTTYGDVQLSSGHFTVDGPVVGVEGATLRGLNWNDTIIQMKAATASHIVYCSALTDFTLEKLQLYGDNTHQTVGADDEQCGFFATACKGLKIVDVWANYCVGAGFYDFGNDVADILGSMVFDRCKATNGLIDGWLLRSDFVFITNSFTGANGNHGIVMGGKNSYIIGTTSADNGKDGIYLDISSGFADGSRGRNQIEGCHIAHNHNNGIGGNESYRNTIIGCNIGANGNHGIWLYQSKWNKIVGNTFTYNGANSASYSNVYFSGTVGSRATHNLVSENLFGSYATVYELYNIREGAYSDYNTFTDNIFGTSGVTGQILKTGAHTVISGNDGYIAPGEIRTISGALAGVTPAGIMTSIDNPFGQAVRVLSVDVSITTQGAGSGTMCAGIGSDPATDYATMFSVLPCDPGTTYPYFYNSTKTATYGVQVDAINWATGANNRYLNFYAHVANNGLVGTYTITVMGN